MEVEPLDLYKNASLAKCASFQVRRMVIEAGQNIPPHYHSECTDIILPLSGQARLLLASGAEQNLETTRLYKVPAKEIHSIVNDSLANAFVYLLIQDGSYDFKPAELRSRSPK